MLSAIRFRTFMLSVCCIAFLQSGLSAELPAKENFHLFLLVGQSNMAGRGKVDEASKVPHSRVLMLSKEDEWVPATDPLHFDKPKIVGVGLGKTFGEIIAEANPDITIGLIPCAVGGSEIDTWQPKTIHKQTKLYPWDSASRRTRVALEKGTLKGILWHQGESDSTEKRSVTYEAKLRDLIKRFRREFDAENVPFIIGQLGQFPDRPWNEHRQRVDQAHQTIAKDVPYSAFVTSTNLGHRGDQTHFNTKAYRELGRRYAKAYLEMQQQ